MICVFFSPSKSNTNKLLSNVLLTPRPPPLTACVVSLKHKHISQTSTDSAVYCVKLLKRCWEEAILSHVGWLVVAPIRRVAAEIDNNIRVPNSSKLGIKSATNVLVKRRYGQAILPISGAVRQKPNILVATFFWNGQTLIKNDTNAFILNKIQSWRSRTLDADKELVILLLEQN